MWYIDPLHPELGAMFVPDSEAAAVPAHCDVVSADHPEVMRARQVERAGAEGDVEWTDFGEAAPPDSEPGSFRFTPYPRCPPEQLKARLAEARCYWCGAGLRTTDPWETFCTEDHEEAWRVRTQTSLADVSKVHNGPDYHGHDRPEPEHGETPPSFLGDRRSRWSGGPPVEPMSAEELATWAPLGFTEDFRADFNPGAGATARAFPRDLTDRQRDMINRAISGRAITPEPARYPRTTERSADRWSFVAWTTPPLAANWDWKIIEASADSVPRIYAPEPSTLEPRGIIATRELFERSQRSGQDFALGGSYVPGHPALREARNTPWTDRTEWPVWRVQSMEAHGWHPAVIADPSVRTITEFYADHPAVSVAPNRRCPHCQQTGVPIVHTAEFGYPGGWDTEPLAMPPEGPTYGARVHMRLDIRRATYLICAACLLPYPGPTAVPMVRRIAGGWNMAVVTTVGVFHGGVSEQAVEAYTPPALSYPTPVDRMWGDMWREAMVGSSPYPCVVGDCTGNVLTWWELAAPMTLGGRILVPEDGEPLLLPTCPMHTHDLMTGIYGSYDLRTRVRVDDERGSSVHMIV